MGLLGAGERVSRVASMVQERRILEETVTPLTPAGLLSQQPGQTAATPPGAVGGTADALKNTQRIPAEGAEQHASMLHFFQGEMG